MLFLSSAILFLLSSSLGHAYPYQPVNNPVHLQDALVTRNDHSLYGQDFLYPREEKFYEYRKREADFYNLHSRRGDAEPAPMRLMRRVGIPRVSSSSRTPTTSTPSSGYHTPNEQSNSRPVTPPGGPSAPNVPAAGTVPHQPAGAPQPGSVPSPGSPPSSPANVPLPPSAPSTQGPSRQNSAANVPLPPSGASTPQAPSRQNSAANVPLPPSRSSTSSGNSAANVPLPPSRQSTSSGNSAANVPLPPSRSSTGSGNSAANVPLPPSRGSSQASGAGGGQQPAKDGSKPGDGLKTASGVLGPSAPIAGNAAAAAGVPPPGPQVIGGGLGAAALGTGIAGGVKAGDPAHKIAGDQAGNAASVVANTLGGANQPKAAQGSAIGLTTAGLGSQAAQHGSAINQAAKEGKGLNEAANRAPAMAGAAGGLGVAGGVSNSLAATGHTPAAQGTGIAGGATALGGTAVDALKPKPKGNNNDIEMQRPGSPNRRRDLARRSVIARQVADNKAALMSLVAREAEKRAAAGFLRRREGWYADEL